MLAAPPLTGSGLTRAGVAGAQGRRSPGPGTSHLADLEDATSGTVSIGGRVVNDLPPKQRDIAMVFQNHALYPHMTVDENTTRPRR